MPTYAAFRFEWVTSPQVFTIFKLVQTSFNDKYCSMVFYNSWQMFHCLVLHHLPVILASYNSQSGNDVGPQAKVWYCKLTLLQTHVTATTWKMELDHEE